jgi:NitT/TauT family transport system substrate-binding protein
MARIKQLKQLDDKMLAMTRYSATDLLADFAVDSAKLKHERVFRIQLNDVGVRLSMLQTGTMDALLLPEPQATQARQLKAPVLMDSRKLDLHLGVIGFSRKALRDTARQRQVDVFIKAYNMACDTINAQGLARFRRLIEQRCGMKPGSVDSLPADIRFDHAQAPRQKDIDRAKAWLQKK